MPHFSDESINFFSYYINVPEILIYVCFTQKLSTECIFEGHSGVLVPFKCDLSSEEEILAMFTAIKAQHGGVDVCINNAGLAHPEPLLNGKASGWKNMLDVRGLK